MKKLLFIFGTRPEAIKMAPLIIEFKKNTLLYEVYVCVTGQHRQMLDQVLELFQIQPDYDLNIMKQGQDLYDITAKVILGLKDILNEVQPDLVFVHGDTSTSTIAALAAFYKQIPVAHVEAGLRTYNVFSPWPEEMNRQLTGRIASLHFAPTERAATNLIQEGVNKENISITGNTVIDSLLWVVNKIKTDKTLSESIAFDLKNAGYDIDRLNEKRKMVLITGHRRENFGEGFHNICKAIHCLSDKYKEIDFVYPMHLNPNVRKPIHDEFGEDLSSLENIFFIEPLEYLHFIFLMEKSYLILTDSGGVQEEAPSLGKPVLVMRDTTERPEALDAGTVDLVGTSFEKIVSKVSLLLDNNEIYHNMSKALNPYGDGLASKKIVEFCNKKF